MTRVKLYAAKFTFIPCEAPGRGWVVVRSEASVALNNMQ